MITSTANRKVKQVIRWQNDSGERKRDHVFVVEGPRMVEEAPDALLREIYVTEDFLQRLPVDSTLSKRLKQTGCETVTREVLERMSDTRTPQGILAVLNQPDYDWRSLLTRPNPFFVVLEDLQDPGNLGTILRTGEGAGVTGILMSRKTADPFNPKTIRSTMGSVYRTPFAVFADMGELLEEFGKAGIRTCAAHLNGRCYYDEPSFREPCAILIGNEGKGLSAETAKRADVLIRIPMEGQVESLNAAVAAALLMYEVHRQRA